MQSIDIDIIKYFRTAQNSPNFYCDIQKNGEGAGKIYLTHTIDVDPMIEDMRKPRLKKPVIKSIDDKVVSLGFVNVPRKLFFGLAPNQSQPLGVFNWILQAPDDTLYRCSNNPFVDFIRYAYALGAWDVHAIQREDGIVRLMAKPMLRVMSNYRYLANHSKDISLLPDGSRDFKDMPNINYLACKIKNGCQQYGKYTIKLGIHPEKEIDHVPDHVVRQRARETLCDRDVQDFAGNIPSWIEISGRSCFIKTPRYNQTGINRIKRSGGRWQAAQSHWYVPRPSRQLFKDIIKIYS